MPELPPTVYPTTREESQRARLLEQFGTPAGLAQLNDLATTFARSTQPVASPLALTPTPTPTPYISDPSHPDFTGFDPALPIDNLVELWNFLFPELTLHRWQEEELYRLSGYIYGHPFGPRIHWFKHKPYLATYVGCNGSGKDKVINTMTAMGLPLLYRNVSVVATSSSNKQLKEQTQAHILEAVNRLNAKLGRELYRAVEFHIECPERGAYIDMFSTDEAGRAEGWHPLTPDGRLVIIINEAKTISPAIFTAFNRCRGYSHWIEISSPDMRSGRFYRNFRSADQYPEAQCARPGFFFARRISYLDCPHITEAEVQVALRKDPITSYFFRTSFLAEFCEEDIQVIIPFDLIEACDLTPAQGIDIGIGMDCAAGGDETVVWVRRGNKPIDLLAFRERNLTVAAQKISDHLAPYKPQEYIFYADDGGVGRGLIDILIKMGWKIRRVLNQSVAYDNTRYANLGAQTYWHLRDLYEAGNIVAPADEKTRLQTGTRRKCIGEGTGKKKLESKLLLRSEGIDSPDRADALVLCFFSYKLTPLSHVEPEIPSTLISAHDLFVLAQTNPAKFAALFNQSPTKSKGIYTCMTLEQ